MRSADVQDVGLARVECQSEHRQFRQTEIHSDPGGTSVDALEHAAALGASPEPLAFGACVNRAGRWIDCCRPDGDCRRSEKMSRPVIAVVVAAVETTTIERSNPDLPGNGRIEDRFARGATQESVPD